MIGTCENCKFGVEIYPAEIYQDEIFDANTAQIFVLCHRNPPQLLTIPKRKKAIWSWALVGKKEWCGEYKPKDGHED